jgi:hypothetical protein
MARTDKNRLDDALGEIATLVKIPEDRGPYFRSLVRGTVNDAVPRIKRLRFSDESIASQLKTVTRKTHELLAHLRKNEIAGLRLRAAAMDRGLTIKHFTYQLELLAEVAEIAAADIDHSKPSVRAGRPRGTPGNLGFDLFVQQLIMDARVVHVRLTIFKSPSANSGWGGSLLKTVELLRAHLPDDFVPKARLLGRRLYRIVHPRN